MFFLLWVEKSRKLGEDHDLSFYAFLPVELGVFPNYGLQFDYG